MTYNGLAFMGRFEPMQQAAWQILALCVFLPPLLRADTTVAVWTEPQVTIASDSRRTIARNGKILETEDACKLQLSGDLVVAAAGLASHEGEDLAAAITTARSNRGDAKSAHTPAPLAMALSGARSALTRIMTLRERFSDTHIYDTGLNVSVIFAGLADGKPSLTRMDIRRVPLTPPTQGSSTDFTTSVVEYPERRGPKRAIEIIGAANAISRFKTLSPRDWNSGSDLEVATRLIAIEARDPASSPFAGGPVSSLRIDSKGVHWIQKGLCTWEPQK
jgi:hypothetical protein